MAGSNRLPWRNFAPILAVHFIGTLGFSIAIPFLVFLVSDFGGAAWTYGLLGATYSTLQTIGAPWMGRWSDRVGRRRVLIVSQGGTLLAWSLFLVALQLPLQSLGQFAGASLTVPLLLVFAARALDGVTGGNISVASAYVADLTRGLSEQRQVAFGRMGMAASLGFTVGPALAGVLGATVWGYSAPVAAAVVVSALALVLCVRLREPTGRCPEGPPPQPAVTRLLGQQQRRCDRAPAARPRGALRRPIIVALLGATFLQFLAFNLFYASFPLHAQGVLGWDAGQMGLFFTVLSATMLLAQGPLLRVASKAVSPAVTFGIGMALLVLAFVHYAQGQAGLFFVGALLFATGNGLAWPTFQARLADVAGEAAQGAVQGASASAGSLASIVGLLAGGALQPLLGNGVFAISAALFTVAGLGTPWWFGLRSSR